MRTGSPVGKLLIAARIGFLVFFLAYVAGLAVWLSVGLAPAIVDAVPSLHGALHDRSGDDLEAAAPVAIRFTNESAGSFADPHGIAILAEDGAVVFRGRPIEPGNATIYRFDAPPAGDYELTGGTDGDVSGRLRFTEEGDRSLAITTNGEIFEKRSDERIDSLAGRMADASHQSDHGLRVMLETAFSVLNLALGLLLVVRRPHDWTARLLAMGMIGTAATFNHQSHAAVQLELVGDVWPLHSFFHVMSGLAYVYALLLFPDGRLVPRFRRRWVGWPLHLLLFLVVLSFTTAEVHPGQDDFAVVFGVLIPVVGVAAQTYRLHRPSTALARQQSRLLRSALLPLLLTGVAYLVVGASPGGQPSRIEDFGLALFPVVFALVPLALFVGILRYRLWDIDVVVSRTLLSVGLAAFIGAVYVVVVVLLGRAIGANAPVAGLQIAVTAIVAAAFQPVRERLQRVASRLVYGERASPYEVMADLSERLGSAISVDEVLPRVAHAAAQAVGAQTGRATVYLPDGRPRSFTWPDSDREVDHVVPVSHRGERIGEVGVAMAAGARLAADDRQLLSALAAQAGLAFHNAGLTLELEERLRAISAQAAELRASRERIVTAREALRQRVVGAIRERVEIPLGEAVTGLDDVGKWVTVDNVQATLGIDRVAQVAQHSLDALRDLARNIFPALLADRGLLVALDAHVTNASLPVAVETDGIGRADRFSPRSEAGAYFCLQEVLGTARRYPPGSHVVVRLTGRDGRLGFSIAGDGLEPLLAHADVLGMRDRVEAMDGGLEVRTTSLATPEVNGWVPATETVVRK